jgi:YHS domain-containing protein
MTIDDAKLDTDPYWFLYSEAVNQRAQGANKFSVTSAANNNDRQGELQMTKTSATIKDPVCGMTVEATSAFHATRAGQTFYFCSDHCKQKFMSSPASAKPEGKSGSCCG